MQEAPSLRRSSRIKGVSSSAVVPAKHSLKPVRERWFYEPVSLPDTSRALITFPTDLSSSKPPLVSFGDFSASRPVHMGLVGVSSGISSSRFPSGATAIRVSHSRFNCLIPTGSILRISILFLMGMPVSGLRYNISCLLRVNSLVFLFVGPSWEALDHRGAITDRCFPGTHQPCPFLVDGSAVRVRCTRFSSSTAVSSLPSSVLIAGISSSPDSLLGESDSSPQISAPFHQISEPLGESDSSLQISAPFPQNFAPFVPFLATSTLPLVDDVLFPSSSNFPLANAPALLSHSVTLDSVRVDHEIEASQPGAFHCLLLLVCLPPPAKSSPSTVETSSAISAERTLDLAFLRQPAIQLQMID